MAKRLKRLFVRLSGLIVAVGLGAVFRPGEFVP